MPHRVGDCRSRARGFSGIEVLIGTVVLSALILGAYNTINRAGHTMETVFHQTALQSEIRESIQRVAEDLKRAGNISITEADVNGDVVTFQRPLAVHNGTIEWGSREYAQIDGMVSTLPRPGHWLQYRVVSAGESPAIRRLVLRALDPSKTTVIGEDEVIAEFIAPMTAYGKGFAIAHADNLLSIEIRIQRPRSGPHDAPGESVYGCHTIALQTTVLARNWRRAASDQSPAMTALIAALNIDEPDALSNEQLTTVLEKARSELTHLDRTSLLRTMLASLTERNVAILDTRRQLGTIDAARAADQLAAFTEFAAWLAHDTIEKWAAEDHGETALAESSARDALADGDAFRTVSAHQKAAAAYRDAVDLAKGRRTLPNAE